MSAGLEDFQKKHDFLICVDSDGCAVDTMDIKHKQCFGPCLIQEWGLEQWEQPILERWNEINLYTQTRGINRFKGLALALEEVNQKYTPIQGLEKLKKWTEESQELSNPALEGEIARTGEPVLKKALNWSLAVNKKITELPWEVKHAFPGVKEAFEGVRDFADLVIVSSANRDAVEEEWTRFGLLRLVDMVLCQDAGSKAHCIAQLKQKGYEQENVLMVGDASGDMAAADANGVNFYPIIVQREEECWENFAQAAQHLRTRSYWEYGRQVREEFLSNFAKNTT